MNDTMAKFMHEHALDVAMPTASVICERIKDGLAEMSGTDMHRELSVIIYTSMRAYFECYEFKVPDPSPN